MTRMYLIASAIFAAAMMIPGSASAQQIRERVHAEQHERMRESYGGQTAMPPGYYQPAHALTRRLMGLLFDPRGGRRAGPPVIREIEYCPQGGRLERLPNSTTVACLISVRQGDPTIRTVQYCPNGGTLGFVPGVDHQVCIVSEAQSDERACPQGGHLGRVPGVDHEVCVRE